MKRWQWVVAGLGVAACASWVFISWFNQQLWPTGQKMARGPNQIAYFEYGVQENQGNNVFLLDLDSGEVIQLTGGNLVKEMNWSPDGSVLIINTGSAGAGLQQIDPATGAISPLAGAESPPDFGYFGDISPDGTQVVYLENHTMNSLSSPIMVANLDGSSPQQIGSGGPARWSPDGTRIAFATTLEGGEDADIYTMAPDGSDLRKVIANPGNDDLPVWSPDGKQIAFVGLQYDGWGAVAANQTFLVDQDGQNLTRIGEEDGQVAYKQDFVASGKVLFKTGLGFMCLVPVDGGEPNCEYTWSGTLSPDGTRVAATVLKGMVLNTTGDNLCVFRIEGAEFKRKCYVDRPHQLGNYLWRP